MAKPNMTRAQIDTEIMYAITYTITPEILSHLTLPKLIAISGKMGTGKDTIYRILEIIARMRDEITQNHKFAKKLKEIVAPIENIQPSDLESQAIKYAPSKLNFDSTIRDTLIYLGTKIRERNPNYFVESLLTEIGFSNADINIITDLRFKNELEAIEKKAVIWRVIRDNTSKSSDMSETDLDDYKFEYIIQNNGTITELVQTVIGLLINYSNEVNFVELGY